MKKKTYKSGLMQEEIDTETGEILRQTITTEKIEGFVDLKLPEKHKFNNGGFIVLFQKSMNMIAKNNKKFTRNELTILFFFLANTGMGNSVFINYQLLVNELKIRRENCVRAITGLVKKNIILKNKVTARHKNEGDLMKITLKTDFDQINYNLAFNGKVKDYSKLKFKHPPLKIEE